MNYHRGGKPEHCWLCHSTQAMDNSIICHCLLVHEATKATHRLLRLEAKRARREQEKVQKKNARCGESSQVRYKLCSIFMFDSTVVVLELHGLPACTMRTYALAWRGAARDIMRMRIVLASLQNLSTHCVLASVMWMHSTLATQMMNSFVNWWWQFTLKKIGCFNHKVVTLVA